MTIEKPKKRVLWLLNHTTLREFEVPLLLSLNFEVYTSKIFPNDHNFRSGSMDFNYDATLSLPKHIIEKLNQHNFYTNYISSNKVNIINEYFDIAFVSPMTLTQISLNFKGVIILRAFGLGDHTSYTKLFYYLFGKNFTKSLDNLDSRFWFGEIYSHFHNVEKGILRSNHMTLPAGLKKGSPKNTWNGSIKKIFFVCPSLATEPYKSIYLNFKKYFSHHPYLIAGEQPIPVTDQNVAGFASQELFDSWLRDLRVMFYHSKQKNHLHYHPVEAMQVGMPVIFLSGGLLEIIGGKKQPGMCKTIEEAVKKIDLIIKDDHSLIQEIKDSQQELVKKFSFEYCKETWERELIPKINKFYRPSINNAPDHIPTIGIFLPINYRGGTLNDAKNIAIMLFKGSRLASTPVNIVFSCVENTYDIKREFKSLLDIGIKIRETKWQEINSQELRNIQNITFDNTAILHNQYLLPCDGANNFFDCDFWLLISDRTIYPLAPIKPYAVVIYDYIQRYINLFSTIAGLPFIHTARKAEFVITTTPATREDAIQFAGIASERTLLAKLWFNPPKVFNKKNIKSLYNLPHNYFIWPTNLSPHKNHLKTLEGLEIYFKNNGKLKVIITGTNTETLNLEKKELIQNPYALEIKKFIEKTPIFSSSLYILGEVENSEYYNILSKAKFLLHPNIIDNGSFSVVEAAYLKVPSCSNLYPQIEYVNNYFSLNITFFDGNDPLSIAKCIKKMEANHLALKENLPKKEYLEKFSPTNSALDVWNLIAEYI